MRFKTKTTMLLATILLICAVTVVTVFAQPPAMDKDRGHSRSFIEPIFLGHGFALKGEEYHILDVTAKETRDASPGFFNSLFGKKKSYQEVTNEINDAQMPTSMRGHLRFAGQAYALNITGYDNQSLEGDVLTLPPRGGDQTVFTPTIAGHISLSISRYEGDLLSTGNMTMNGTEYKVLLTSPMMLKRW